MKKIILFIIISIISFNGVAECGPEVSLDEEWEDTQAIFIGKVISDSMKKPIYDVSGKRLNYVTIKISRIFKCDYIQMLSDTTTFFELNIESFRFKEGMEYLIFANSVDYTFFYTTVCSRTCLLSKAQDIIPILEKKALVRKDDHAEEKIIERRRYSR